MAKARPFSLIYAPDVKRHLQAIGPKYFPLIRSAIEGQLLHEPEGETRNRKPLKRPVTFGATWELRFGPDNRFRAFYRVDRERRAVIILAIGVKHGNQLEIGGERIKL